MEDRGGAAWNPKLLSLLIQWMEVQPSQSPRVKEAIAPRS